jgi:hypothetical protein
MVSGHVNRTRPNPWLHRPKPATSGKSLPTRSEPQARFFCKNRGVALLLRKGNPLGIHGLADVVRKGTRIALPDSGDVRAKCLAATEKLLGKPAASAVVGGAEFPEPPNTLHGAGRSLIPDRSMIQTKRRPAGRSSTLL